MTYFSYIYVYEASLKCGDLDVVVSSGYFALIFGVILYVVRDLQPAKSNNSFNSEQNDGGGKDPRLILLIIIASMVICGCLWHVFVGSDHEELPKSEIILHMNRQLEVLNSLVLENQILRISGGSMADREFIVAEHNELADEINVYVQQHQVPFKFIPHMEL